MNKINSTYNWVIKSQGFDKTKKISYQVLSKQLSPRVIKKAVDFFDKADKKLQSYQNKLSWGTTITNGFEKGSPVLGVIGKTAGTVNNYCKISGLDTVETTAHVAEYSKSRNLTSKGQSIDKLLERLRGRIAQAKSLFQHISDLQQQVNRQEEFLDLNCPMNAIEVTNQEDWEGEYELIDLEIEDENAQEKRNSQLGKGWETVKKEDSTPKLTTNAWVKKQSKLKSALKEALTSEVDYKSQVKNTSEEEWVEWSKIAKEQAINHQSSSILLKYAKKGQGVFKLADGRIKAFAFEVNAIKELAREIQKQLGYSLVQKGLSKARLDKEKLNEDLKSVIEWADYINERVSQVNSYVKVGGNIANKIVNNLERKSEYKALVNNPYGYNDKEDIKVFEDELEIIEKSKAEVEVVQEKPKGWFSWLKS